MLNNYARKMLHIGLFMVRYSIENLYIWIFERRIKLYETCITLTYPLPWRFPRLWFSLQKQRKTYISYIGYMSKTIESNSNNHGKQITWFPSEGTLWWIIHWESTTPIFSWAGYMMGRDISLILMFYSIAIAIKKNGVRWI